MNSFRIWLVLPLLALGCINRTTSDGAASKELESLDALRQQDPEAAAGKLKTHLQQSPEDDLAWVLLGHCHDDLKQVAEAEVAYTKALEINPNQFQALTGMGIQCRKKQAYAEAMSFYRRAIAIDPQYAQAYSSMSIIALKQNNDAEALEFAKQGYNLDPADPALAANLAVAYHYNGQLALRDKLTAEAERLGYKKIAILKQFYSGEMSVRD